MWISARVVLEPSLDEVVGGVALVALSPVSGYGKPAKMVECEYTSDCEVMTRSLYGDVFVEIRKVRAVVRHRLDSR